MDGFDDPDHLRGIRKSEVPVPVWLIGADWADETPECLYWRKACGCEQDYDLFDPQTHVFERKRETEYPLNQHKAPTAVWTSKISDASEAFGYKLNRGIWKDFLYQYAACVRPGGSLRKTQDPVRDLGMEYRYEMVDGYCR